MSVVCSDSYYASRKLKAQEKQLLQDVLDGLSYSCGSPLQDAELPECLQDEVFVRSMQCEEPIEALYYSANYADICVNCAIDIPPVSKGDHFPQCEECSSKPKIPRRKSRKK